MRSDRFALRSLSLLVSLALLPWTVAAAQTAPTAPTASVALPRLTQPIDEKDLVPIRGTLPGQATAKNDRGVVNASSSIGRVHLMLKRSAAQEQQLTTLLQNMHTPGAASYHKWLTPDQFGAQFGPSDQDIAKITNWLGSHGLTVAKVNPGKQTLEITGSTGSFSAAFHTSIHTYEVDGHLHTANASDPQIPAALAPVVGGFASLNNFQLKSQMKSLGTARYEPAAHKAVPNWTTGPNSDGTYNYIFAPGDFAVQYDLNPLYKAGTVGTGQTIAIINEANIDPALVAAYRSLFQLPASTPNVIIDGNDPGVDGINNPDGLNGASGEAYLDVEEAGAVAPGATIDLVIAADTPLESGLILAAEHAVYANTAPVLSLSFGGCEAGQTEAGNAFISGLWEQAAAQGQTVLVSSGDNGSAGCDNDNLRYYAVEGQAVNGLASTPYNVAVGGTDFFYSSYAAGGTAVNTQLAQYWGTPTSNVSNATPTPTLQAVVPEQPWNNSQYGLNLINYYDAYGHTTIAGGSGGASNCATGAPLAGSGQGGSCAGYAKPSWQTGTGVPADGVRDLPDVSLFASNGLNYSFYPICAVDGDCQTVSDGTVQISGVGGTSASTPAFAGIMALVNQTYGPQGQADFVLYPLAQQFPAAFHDVTNGTNTVPCGYSEATPDCIAVAGGLIQTDPTYGKATEGAIGTGTTQEYGAAAGYDLASGLGSVDANVLLSNWNKVTFTGSTVTLTPSQTTFAHGTAITIAGAVTPGTAGGSVALETTSTEPLQAVTTAFPVTAGAYTGSVNTLPGGTYTIFGKYSGDGVNGASSSTPVSITVTPEASSVELQGLNEFGSTVQSGTTVAYGTQIELSAQAVPTTYYTSCVNANPAASCASTSYTNPTGSVTFTDSNSTLNQATVNAEGDAEFNAPFSVGAHSVSAAYSGDASYAASTAGPIAFTVAQDQPDVLFGAGYTASASGTEVIAGTTSLTIAVENSANDGSEFPNSNSVNPYFYSPVATPTGTVTVTGLGTGTLTSAALVPGRDPSYNVVEGVAQIAVPASVPAGTYQVTVTYTPAAGDPNYASSSSTGTLEVLTPALTGELSTTTTATTSAAATAANSAVTIAVTVAGTTAGGAPTGDVLLESNGYQLGEYAVTQGASTTSTVNILVASQTLNQGTNVITLQYLGDNNYLPSSATVNVVNSESGVSGTTGTTPAITLSSNAAISIASPGGSGTSTITVTPANGFTGAVALSCAVTPSTLTDTPTCSVTQASVTGTAPATATLTVNTTAAPAAAVETPRLRTVLGGGIAMASLLFLVAPKRRRRLTTLLGAVVLMAAIGFSAGCGSGSGPTSGGTQGGTATGTYTVTVTGTASGISNATTTVQVTVQ